MTAAINNTLAKWWDFVDNRGIVRRLVLFVTLWMTWRSFAWAGEFAFAAKLTGGIEIAAIIAAVTAPIAALQAAIFKQYLDSK